jgi:hypothetical protein
MQWANVPKLLTVGVGSKDRTLLRQIDGTPKPSDFISAENPAYGVLREIIPHENSTGGFRGEWDFYSPKWEAEGRTKALAKNISVSWLDGALDEEELQITAAKPVEQI